MIDTRHCPRNEELSAFIDGALGTDASESIARHAKECPLCGARMNEFLGLRERLQHLRGVRCEVDLAPLVNRRLEGRASTRAPRRRAWWPGWQLVPQGFGAAGMLAAGLYLGQVLAGGAAAARPAAMAVFDASPPGALCAGRCYREER